MPPLALTCWSKVSPFPFYVDDRTLACSSTHASASEVVGLLQQALDVISRLDALFGDLLAFDKIGFFAAGLDPASLGALFLCNAEGERFSLSCVAKFKSLGALFSVESSVNETFPNKCQSAKATLRLVGALGAKRRVSSINSWCCLT